MWVYIHIYVYIQVDRCVRAYKQVYEYYAFATYATSLHQLVIVMEGSRSSTGEGKGRGGEGRVGQAWAAALVVPVVVAAV